MRRKLFLLATLFVAAFANAQTDIDMSNFFIIQNGEDGKPKPIDLNDPCTAKDGIIFIGDTRPADKIQDNKYRGMRVTKSRRHFTVNGAVRQYQTSMAFRRAPQGVSKDHVVDVTLVPRSCMIQVKPTSDGKLTLCAQTNKPEGQNVYVAVRNGDDFKNIATLKFVKDEEVKGNKATPYQPQSLDYKYADGDELWIYSDGSVNLYGFIFSGSIDKSFTGSEPLAVAKAVSKARK